MFPFSYGLCSQMSNDSRKSSSFSKVQVEKIKYPSRWGTRSPLTVKLDINHATTSTIRNKHDCEEQANNDSSNLLTGTKHMLLHTWIPYWLISQETSSEQHLLTQDILG